MKGPSFPTGRMRLMEPHIRVQRLAQTGIVLAFGANPAVVGVLALTCGYCGTLLTPMAANFNIVPVALLEMKDRMGVIRNQILPALVMISVQIVYMLIAS